MKKHLLLLAALFCLAGCHPDDPIIIIDDGGEDFEDTTLSCSVDVMAGIETTDYGMGVITMPGKEILDFFEMTAKEFYLGIGEFTTGSTSSAQSNNTISFGVCTGNDIEKMNFCPSTSNNLGCWFDKSSAAVTWGDDAVFYHESNIEWGLSDPDDETLASMWDFTFGFYPGHNDYKAGEKVKATYFFYKEAEDDDDKELYCYVEMIFNITEAKAVELDVVKTQEITIDNPYIPDWGATSIDEYIDFDAVASAIGCSADDAVVYAFNSDGSVYPAAGTNFWFSVAGDVIQYGEGCGIDINKDAGYWTYCNYPDETLAGQTCKGAIAFVNTSTNKAYLVKLTVNLSSIDYTSIDVMVSYEEGETVYTLTESNIAAISEALGTGDTFNMDEIELVGINADGSQYAGDFTANNGYWYNLAGDVADWAAIEADGYLGEYIEYRGDNSFGCGFWEESGATATVKLGLKKGDAMCILTFNLTVAEPAVYETEEIGTATLSATQKLSDGYAGQIVDITEVLATLGTEDFTVLDAEGGCTYTSNGGFWYDAEGNVVGWGDTSAFFFEPSYGEDETFLGLGTGIKDDVATAGSTYTATFRIADINAMKHVTCNFSLTVTE